MSIIHSTSCVLKVSLKYLPPILILSNKLKAVYSCSKRKIDLMLKIEQLEVEECSLECNTR